MNREPYRIAHTPVHPISASIVMIEMIAELSDHSEISLGTGTGFLEDFEGKKYLVTNWHCVTGRDPLSGQPRATDGVIPNKFKIRFHKIKENSIDVGNPIIGVFDLDEPWIMHPAGQDIDIAAVEIPNDWDFIKYSIRSVVGAFDPMLAVGDEVFIIGFPLSMGPSGSLPLWKRGSVASEPAVPAFGQPCYLVDSASRPGMSGSPILGRIISAKDYPNLPGNGPVTKDTLISYTPTWSFLGIYSGRIGVKDLFEAQIGKVWRPETIQEMLGNPRKLDFILK
ncbi:S1 family peptidase [Roseomonas haemaphysalidis]|uniref:Trypsin-like peptidase domain-containing protein n=1 Tax=Roseomonas haemaphysalidis TaxID=2768162 RepID=A0ABS3KW95_9PROT|nr:serine protease [Roseomonas haemaphysalidis]MBO1081743.1 trypsin-like peptidase domain-containing protein [Roseomonas haemaphysalidis]